MACRSTGFALLSSGSVQEAMDLAAASHLAAVKSRVPFLHFFDGFRTSHEIQKIMCLDYNDLAALVDQEALQRFRDEALNPEHPTLRNTVQNPDVYFQFREANNRFYDALPAVVEECLSGINSLTGRNYGLFNYYGAPDADRVVIAMGSASGTIMDTVDYINGLGEKVGYVQVHLYRPFSVQHLLAAVPETVGRIAVLDRCKEHGAVGEPLYEDICSAYYGRENQPLIVGGRYGLSSKDVDPAQIKAVFDNLAETEPRNHFTIGITDDVTNLSLKTGPVISTEAPGTICCKFWGLGSDGTVGANKNSIKIIGEHTDYYAQAYFEYDTKKSFGITKSHLRFGKQPIRATHLIKRADFVACHNQSYLGKYDIVSELKDGGVFLLNCSWTEEELDKMLPGSVKRFIAEHKIRFYTIDANEISSRLGLGNRANMVLQAAFFRLADIIPVDDAVRYMKDAVEKTYGKKGDIIVQMNNNAVDGGIDGIREIDVPAAWETAEKETDTPTGNVPDFIRNIQIPINAQKGDDLPVSCFTGYEDGTMPLATSAYEKRGIATALPVWNPANCIQCYMCSYVCPHGVIRPYLLSSAETENAPEGFVMSDAKGASAKDYKYSLQMSAPDCTGCGTCAAVCPAKDKALEMVPASEAHFDDEHWGYAQKVTEKDGVFDPATVKGSQFIKPLLEFSGACAGCGETPYAKLLTQLYGGRIYWANATGCSQAWGASMPCIPYTVNSEGKGPAWSNSLFENNAEFSLGMCLAVKQQRLRLKEQAAQLAGILRETNESPEGVSAAENWLRQFFDPEGSASAGKKLVTVLSAAHLSGEAGKLAEAILRRKDHLSKKSIWMYGGDGWAYDIGYGGLDHVFATGEDVNVLVVDTEVYSNTGGQASKATPLGASAQFQSSGKKSGKKDLGRLMMTYGNVYVAQVSMGADPGQLIRALKEADSFPGPSLVIAYAPCIAHGIKAGMQSAQNEMKRAVQAGYWHLYRYNPLHAEHPFTLDSKEPTLSFEEFLDGETRYAALRRTFPENAKVLFEKAAREAKEKYLYYKRLEDHSCL
jgi:pyruvate-ferredoxin/flavodoxin oxidoreductase